MNQHELLDTMGVYKFVLHRNADKYLMGEFFKMYEHIKASGHSLSAEPWPVDSGIVVSIEDTPVAAAFFNTTKYKDTLLLHLIYVDSDHRRRGIYRNLHRLLDVVGLEQGKTRLYSYIHSSNLVMVNDIMEKIGYKEVMKLVSRNINEKSDS